MKKLNVALVISLLYLPIMALNAGVISADKISSSDIKTFKLPNGQKHKWTHKVNSKIYGKYKLCAQDVNFPKFAQVINLKSNGKGYAHFKGQNEPKRFFKWGAYIQNGKLHVFDGVKDYKSHTIVWQYDDDKSFFQRNIQERNGKVGMIGNYDYFMKNGSCK